MSFSLGQLIGMFFLGGFSGVFMAREDEQESPRFDEVKHD